ncbi:MAG: hypothetical protein GXP49_02960 [Deltaproteobacteria bacterium]|nr:hypothetical protein [Deltaproteobacteria bacterium]
MQDSVEIRWETDIESSSVVLWGPPNNPNKWVQGEIVKEDYSGAMLVKPRPGFRHRAVIHGLQPDTLYSYRVEYAAKNPADGTFVTAPKPDEPFKMVIFGDTRTDYNEHKAVVDAIMDESPDLVIHLGDLVFNATKDELWDDFFKIEGDMIRETPIYPIFGNHELMMEGVYKYRTMFGPFESTDKERYYSFDYGPLHGIAIDTEDRPYNGTAQREWVEKDLQQAVERKPKPLIMVFFHRPLYTFSGVRGPERKLRAELQPVLEKYGVAAVIWGHEHCYEHFEVNGVPYITSGGGGAPLTSLMAPEGDDAKYWKMGQSVYHYIRLDITPHGFTAEVVRIPDLAVIDSFSKEI